MFYLLLSLLNLHQVCVLRVALGKRCWMILGQGIDATTDINAIPVLKKLTHLPVIIDPSHSTGDSAYVSAIAKAGVAAGADGVIVEVHNDPAHAISDGKQSLTPEAFAKMVKQIKAIAEAVDRQLVAHHERA